MSIPRKLFFLAVAFLLPVQVLQAEQTVTVEQAVQTALRNNPDLRMSRFDVSISESILRETKAPLYPQVQGKMVVPFVGRESGFYVDQMIWDFGRTRSAVKSQELYLKSAEHSFEGTKRLLERDVRTAYYQALSGRNRLAEAHTQVKRRQWNLEKTQELFSAGSRSASELGQAKIDLQNARLELASRENSYQLAKLRLRNLMNDPELVRFELAEQLDYEKLMDTREDLISSALAKNADIKSLTANQAGIKAEISGSRREFFPSVFGRAAYRFEGEGAETPAFIAGVGVKIPIFEGFSRSAKTNRVKSELEKNQARIESLKNKIVFEVEQLYLHLKHIEKRIDILAESESVLRSNLLVAQQRHDAENISQIDLAQAQSLYEKSVADYKNSIYDYKIAKLQILSLCGIDIP